MKWVTCEEQCCFASTLLRHPTPTPARAVTSAATQRVDPNRICSGFYEGSHQARGLALSEQMSRSSPQKKFYGDRQETGFRNHILGVLENRRCRSKPLTTKFKREIIENMLLPVYSFILHYVTSSHNHITMADYFRPSVICTY